jgi:hypothetical protein
LLLRGDGLQLPDKIGRERFLHLLIELGDIEVADAVDQKRADHTHKGQNQNDHDHDQLRAQRPHRLALLSIFQMRVFGLLRRKVIARAALG